MIFFDHMLWIVVLALLLDALLGDPDWLWKRFPHPVTVIGKAIDWTDKRLNTNDLSSQVRRLNGLLLTGSLTVGALAIGYILQDLLEEIPFGEVLIAALGAILIAQKSLYEHVAAVRDALRTNGLEAGRAAVSRIVGRNPQALDESGVSRAAIESCAENFSDGVVAPVFWFALLGLPGILAYKAINTADSMIGHKTERYQEFGWASARLDDLVNLPASRLAGLLICVGAFAVGTAPKKAFSVMMSDAGLHRSPNAGWPEAAMAGALGIALAGPRHYASYSVDDPYMNEMGRKSASHEDITKALKVMFFACGVQVLALAALSIPF
ncbi:adenosylcobinamide-phosphate synthase CbiB [Pseudovibrio exalbescens]|uniref:adenosylcobinamide-phosphate synthase CbiB n=1 Tax=Pseudovibrio exalbescens TaxID=197461 RepID=UPI002365E6D3|nr:adenosylcobinamide-phosphate synthase CbiB [Pseudovibrio exalbescens]MDD7908457.1 adenosylcobinamide-phosphate synthase CbiB [Pseudovibrio exalbescens]